MTIFLNLNLILTIIAFILILIRNKVVQIDPFEAMNKMNEELEKMNNEKITNFFNNLINTSVSQPIIAYLFTFTICCIPIFNIYMIIITINIIRKGHI